MAEWFDSFDNRVINVHDAEKCAGRPCTIHNPSDHHMSEYPQLWYNFMMHRVCEHNIPHPDPDEPNGNKIHPCDGCCTPYL